MERVHNKLKDSCKRKDLQSVMRKVVVVRRKEEVISRNILWKRSTMQNQKRDFSERKKLKFLKKKQLKGKTLKVYFVCRKPSHFAKNYSRKEKAAELLEQVQIYVEGIPFSNVESLFSFDNDYSPQALVVMAYFTSKEDLASLRPRNPNHLYILAYYSLPNRSYSHSPSAYPPGNLFQTHSSYSPFWHWTYSNNSPSKILPTEIWLSHNQMFSAANGETF